MIKKISHIAVAVHDIHEAAKFYQTLLGLTLGGVEEVESQKTRVGFFKIGETNIELVQPTQPDSPLAAFLETKGPGIHHICFEVDDVDAEVKGFLEKGAIMIDRKPRAGAHNTKIAFVHPKTAGGVLFELCQL